MNTYLTRDEETLAGLVGDASVVALGSFDGFHLGHMAIMEALQKASFEHGKVKSVLFSFYPHPRKVIQNIEIRSISSLRTDLKFLAGCGVNIFYLKRFTKEFSLMPAKDFCDQYLLNLLKCKLLVVGEDARVGRNREGDVNFLSNYLPENGCQVEVIKFVESDHGKIGSAAIRSLISQGKVSEIPELLGRNFQIEGKVVGGKKIGRKLGFPTANIRLGNFERPLPGVYAARVLLDGRLYKAATNIGYAPTYKDRDYTIESYLIDYRGPDFYGERVDVQLVDYLRGEVKYESEEKLISQIHQDVNDIEAILARII